VAAPSPDRVAARGFSLIELIVVMGVVVLLMAIMFPTMAGVRENARRVYCASNLHQIALGISVFSDEHANKGRLPASYFGTPTDMGGGLNPQNMMAVHRGGGDPAAWEGLGHLFAGHYCGAAECFYCPSHHGDHPFEAYQSDFDHPGGGAIFSNYHYAGHLTWHDDRVRYRRLDSANGFVLVTDGLRTASDFNHHNGFNILRSDLAVEWQGDFFRDVYSQLPVAPGLPVGDATSLYGSLWDLIDNPSEVTTAGQ
jgi:prepilin-type N-terminal cleavage/methylation domain-containing protein